jgi:hypothetical protein
MLAVAVQLPASVLVDDPCGPEPEASAGVTSASAAQVADAMDLVVTTNPLFSPARTRRG